MKVRIPYHPVDITVFLLLAFLCYQAHQLVRHFVGAVLCAGFGSMTFTVATTKQPCVLPTIVTLSGPVLTYALAYAGMFLLRSPRYRLVAYALIFASFAHLRFIQVLSGGGDELLLWKQWFAAPGRLTVAVIVFLISVPPLYAAFRIIANKRRVPVFICSWLLPIPLLIVLLLVDKFLFGAEGNVTQYVSFIGIPLIVLIIDLVASVLFIFLGRRYLYPQDEA